MSNKNTVGSKKNSLKETTEAVTGDLMHFDTTKFTSADLYSLGAVKIVMNDILCEYLVSLGYSQHMLIDNLKILIGAVSGIFGGVITYLSMTYDWPVIYKWIFMMVIVYYVINGVYHVLDYFFDHLDFTYKKESVRISTKINNDGIYSVNYKGKEHKMNVYEMFYENGAADRKEAERGFRKIFVEWD